LLESWKVEYCNDKEIIREEFIKSIVKIQEDKDIVVSKDHVSLRPKDS